MVTVVSCVLSKQHTDTFSHIYLRGQVSAFVSFEERIGSFLGTTQISFFYGFGIVENGQNGLELIQYKNVSLGS